MPGKRGKSPFQRKQRLLAAFEIVDNTDQDSVSNLCDTLFDERSENFKDKIDPDFFGLPLIEREEE